MPDLKPKMLVLSMMPALEKPIEAGLKEVSPSATVVKWADIPHPKVLF